MYTCRLISFDNAKAEYFPIELLKITTTVLHYRGYKNAITKNAKVIYWFYGLQMKHDFRRVLRVTKPHKVYEVPR